MGAQADDSCRLRRRKSKKKRRKSHRREMRGMGRNATILATMNLEHLQVCDKQEVSVKMELEMKDARPGRQELRDDRPE